VANRDASLRRNHGLRTSPPGNHCHGSSSLDARRANGGSGEVEKLDAEGSVHAVRKRIKRIRALVRLVGDERGKKAFAKIDARLQGSGKHFAHVRDAEVLVATLEKVKSGTHHKFKSAIVEGLHRRLVARRNAAMAKLLGRSRPVDEISRSLKDVRRDVGDWKFGSDWSVVSPGLMATYGAAQKALPAALADPSIENLHSWRKEAKFLWYQLQFLCVLKPRVISPLDKHLHELTNILGDDHDLAVLTQTVVEHREDWELAEFAVPLGAAILKDRIKLQERAFSLGRKMFSEPPADFAKRLHGRKRAART
jgi:CHAD domain-containing protein